MMLTNIILAAMMTSNPINMDMINPSYKTTPIFNVEFEVFKPQEGIIKQSSQIMLFNSARLIMFDIFYATKPNYTHPDVWEPVFFTVYDKYSNTIVHYQEVCLHRSGRESNPIANIFWERNLWVTGYLLANAFSCIINNFLIDMDNTGISSFMFNLTLTLCELYAIDTWKDSLFTIPLNFYAPIIMYSF